MWVVGQRHATSVLPPGKTRYPLYRRLGGPQDRSWEVRKISPPPRTGIRSPDRLARSQSLCRLSYPGPLAAVSTVLELRDEIISFSGCFFGMGLINCATNVFAGPEYLQCFWYCILLIQYEDACLLFVFTTLILLDNVTFVLSPTALLFHNTLKTRINPS